MTAHHFFVEPEAFDETVVRLTGTEAHHATRSLRVRVGEHITVADGSGRVANAVVAEVGDEVVADVTGVHRCEPLRPSVVLFQALTKGEKFDEVVEKACELGVRRIVPFVAERSIVRWDERKKARARERWSAIAKSAAKQSKSPWIAQVDGIVGDTRSVTRNAAPTLVLHEGAARRLRDALPDDAPPTLGIVVGPEGGFDEAEVDALSAGASVVSLGPRVLRTETAGLVAVAVVAYRYGSVG